MPFFDRDGLRFHYRDEGEGLPFFFQHGLGGDVTSRSASFGPRRVCRLLGLRLAAHGETRPLGDAKKLAHRALRRRPGRAAGSPRIDQAVVGGISLGAAVAAERRRCGIPSACSAWSSRGRPGSTGRFRENVQLFAQHRPADPRPRGPARGSSGSGGRPNSRSWSANRPTAPARSSASSSSRRPRNASPGWSISPRDRPATTAPSTARSGCPHWSWAIARIRSIPGSSPRLWRS